MPIGNQNTFFCSICKRERALEYLKGSFKNDAELQKLITERNGLEDYRVILLEREVDAKQGKVDGSGLKREQESVELRLKGIVNRIRNFAGFLVCVADWNRGRNEALQQKGINVNFTCAFCKREVSGKKYWCHITNGLDKDLNPWLAYEFCKSCWLNEIVPNDKVNYCPRLGSDGEEVWSSGDKYDCQCKVGGKMGRDREGGYRSNY